jgi:lipid-A-disaccharide synthase-like uncharacterized protein
MRRPSWPPAACGREHANEEGHGIVHSEWAGRVLGDDPWGIFWLAFGFAAQGMFAGRFVWQWLVSEKRGRSTVPIGFWILSLVGGTMLLTYACYRKDPVFIAGQGLGVLIYIRNLMLIARRRSAVRQRHPGLLAGQDPEDGPVAQPGRGD